MVLNRTIYTAATSSVVPGLTVLPAGCTNGCVTAMADGTYPGVFNNESVDPSFGVASPILRDALAPPARSSGR